MYRIHTTARRSCHVRVHGKRPIGMLLKERYRRGVPPPPSHKGVCLFVRMLALAVPSDEGSAAERAYQIHYTPGTY